ncbi:hypothetical protein [Methylobacterium sp. WL116]|uniref:hypothetical protein n=1 Tax=Methylobacterium sp. WL116 TaxID=2603889 RepID=UPI0011CB3F8B|nr:hypothetical protein [Methylobacterium sp. WL116]TXM95565.1 hypothetical protein FV223_00415 [Methylobacterium sp. WL116]
MSIRKAIFAAIVLTLAVPLGPASAHDEEYEHLRDHAEHGRFHERVDRAHEAAHEFGLFESAGDHRRYHHRYGHSHEDFHDDYPRTTRDHGHYDNDEF